MTYWYAPGNRGRIQDERRVHTNPNCPPLRHANKVEEAPDNVVERFDLCQICSGEAYPPGGRESNWDFYRAAVEAGRRENPDR